MADRDFDAGIHYLKEMLPAWGSIIEEACRQNLRQYPSPARSTFVANARPHAFGPEDTLICEGPLRQVVFEEMIKDGACSAPTLSRARIYTGKIEILIPFDDMIVKLVDDAEFTVYNVTLPMHILFPGVIKLVVHESNAKTFVAVSGRGIGNWAEPNTVGGPVLFETILERYLVPRVKERITVGNYLQR
jgi:hypothetical protein